jgi:hypothetical protein
VWVCYRGNSWELDPAISGDSQGIQVCFYHIIGRLLFGFLGYDGANSYNTTTFTVLSFRLGGGSSPEILGKLGITRRDDEVVH